MNGSLTDVADTCDNCYRKQMSRRPSQEENFDPVVIDKK